MIAALKTPHDLITFFEREFPDAIPLIGQEKLIKDFFNNPKSSLLSIKVTLWAQSWTHDSAPHTITKIKPSLSVTRHTTKSPSTAKASTQVSKI